MQTLVGKFIVVETGLKIESLRDKETDTPIKTLNLDDVEMLTNTEEIFAQIGAKGYITLNIGEDKTTASLTLSK
jgi:hypothetical protein